MRGPGNKKTDQVSKGPATGGSITTRNTECHGQGHSSKVKGHRTKIPCPCITVPHQYSTSSSWSCWHQTLVHSSAHTNPQWIQGTGPKFHTYAHLPFVGSPHAQTGHIGINTLDAAASTSIPVKVMATTGITIGHPHFHAEPNNQATYLLAALDNVRL